MKKETEEKKPESIQEQIDRVNLENALRDAEIKAAELEEAELRIKERRLNMRDLKNRLDEREITDLQKQQNRASQGQTFAQDEHNDKIKQKICTHKKGGLVSQRDLRALSTGGNSDQYAVVMHQMINSDIWVRCLRCGKTWKPPVEADFYFRDGKVVAPQDGKFDSEAFDKACREYQEALSFPTRNIMSGSVQCRFTQFNKTTKKHEDAAQAYRENVSGSTLR